MISGTVLLEVPGSRAIRRYDRPSATARMTGSSQQRYVRFHRFQRKYRMRLEPDSVNQHLTVTHFPRPTVTHLQEGGTGGEAPPPGQPAGTIHPNPFYADHPWLPFLRCLMRRSCYSQSAGSN